MAALSYFIAAIIWLYYLCNLKLDETYHAKFIEKYKNMILEKEFHPIVIWQKFKKIVVSSSRILLLHFPIKDQVER